MQHEKKHSFFEKIRDRGYYIVLGLCVAAVGVSGYLFSRSVKAPDTVQQVTDALLAAAPSVTVPAATEAPKKKVVKPSERLQEAISAATEAEAPTETEPKLSQTVSPVEGEVMQVYSMDQLAYNATTKDWRTHDGVDFVAPLGAEVYAAADGTVEAVSSDDFFGQTVTIRHAEGYVTHYANLTEDVPVQVGQTVSAGDCIGCIGQTALLESGEAPHLHFSVSRYNVSVDPQVFLS